MQCLSVVSLHDFPQSVLVSLHHNIVVVGGIVGGSDCVVVDGVIGGGDGSGGGVVSVVVVGWWQHMHSELISVTRSRRGRRYRRRDDFLGNHRHHT